MVSNKLGVIFMNSKTIGKDKDKEYYTDKLRQSMLKTTQDLFDYLEIKDVMVFVDLSKDEAIEKLNHLNMKAMEWHAKHWNDNEDMVILVRWIGWDLELNRE